MEHDGQKYERGDCRCEDCAEEMRTLIAEWHIENGRTPPKTIKLSKEWCN